MRTTHVRRTALAIALWLLGTALASAWLVGRTGSPARETEPERGEAGAAPGAFSSGRELYDRHCGRCHDPEDLRPGLGGSDRTGALLALLELLDGHGASDPREDRAIAAYLLERAP